MTSLMGGSRSCACRSSLSLSDDSHFITPPSAGFFVSGARRSMPQICAISHQVSMDSLNERIRRARYHRNLGSEMYSLFDQWEPNETSRVRPARLRQMAKLLRYGRKSR